MRIVISRLLPLLLILSLAFGASAPVSAGVRQLEGEAWTSQEACVQALMPSACVRKESRCRAVAVSVALSPRGDDTARAAGFSSPSHGSVPDDDAVPRPPGQGPPAG